MSQNKLSLTVGFRWKRFLAVAVLIIYQIIGQFVLSSFVINKAEQISLDRLAEATHQFNANFYQHAMSDREQLRVVADMLAVLMDEGTHDLSTHLASFERRGMLDWLQVLLPDGTLITGSGTYDLSAQCNYDQVVTELPFITPIGNGYVDSSKRVIRSAVAIRNNNEIIGVLYGVYDLTAGHSLSNTTAFGGQSYTFIMEPDTGNYLLDTMRGFDFSGTTGGYDAKPGFDLNLLQDDLNACREGFSAFKSKTLDDYMYIYYAPVGINNWMTMISVSEHTALSYANDMSNMMVTSIVYILLGVLVYFIVLYRADHKLQNKNHFVTTIQSRLMEVYNKPEFFHESLQAVAQRAKCKVLFLIDEQLPQASTAVGKDQALLEAYRACQDELNDEILSFSRQHRKNVMLHTSSRLAHQHPRLTRFLTKHGMHSMAIVPILSADGTIHQVMGAFEAQNPDTLMLLNTVSVDFLLAANNIDQLRRMEIASTVDSLTHTMNRVSYHARLDLLSTRVPQGFACIYIDVNDLHAINNRLGHEKGDAMLMFIAETLNAAFGQKDVFRFGGDEFVILQERTDEADIIARMEAADCRIRAEGYTISYGIEWVAKATDINTVIRNAESKMYKAKYQFYQQKEKQAALPSLEHKAMRRLLSENADINAFLTIAEHHYRGVYFVDLATDDVREIFARHYFYTVLQEANNRFSVVFKHYIADVVDKQSRRGMQNFFNYEQISHQLADEKTPTVEYSTVTGERLRLTVHRSPRYSDELRETLWVFEAAE